MFQVSETSQEWLLLVVYPRALKRNQEGTKATEKCGKKKNETFSNVILKN